MGNFNLLASNSSSTPEYIYIFLMLGGLGALLIGMRLLQEATEKLATGGLKNLFKKTANSKMAGVGIGALSTMIMQSSGATTVMVVGFVNAGVMTLAQASTYIMGANIGTTITAQIVALGGVSSTSFPLTEIIIMLTIVGVLIYMFVGKKFTKMGHVGNLIAGLGLLFLGLYVMTTNMNGLFTVNPSIQNALVNTTNPFLLLFIGIAITAVAQSSSAVTSIVLALAISGAVIGGSGNGVLYVILGSNIGSCSTALISAIGSTTNGKRTSIIHLLFNTFGTIIFFIFLICYPAFMEQTLMKIFPSSPAMQIAMFHTFFNIVCTIIFLPLSKQLCWLSEKIIPEKREKKSKSALLDPRFLQTPPIALEQATNFYHQMARKALQDLNLSIEGFVKKDESISSEVDKLEDEVLEMSKDLIEFIVQISSEGISTKGSQRLSRMQLDIADIVRLTEVADNITGYTKHQIDDELHFNPIIFTEIEDMKKLINDQFDYVEKIVDMPSIALLKRTREMEDKIDNQRTFMVQSHLERLNKGECSPSSNGVYINLVGNLERCGDHLNFIAERSCHNISSNLHDSNNITHHV